MAVQQPPQSGSRRPRASGLAQTGQSAGKTRSSAATAHSRMAIFIGALCSGSTARLRSARLAGTERVPATTASAAVLPARRHCTAGSAAVRPIERVAQAQRAPILLERLARLAAPLEDGAEEGVHDRQIGRAHLELLELIGRLVQHLELEVHAAKAGRQ